MGNTSQIVGGGPKKVLYTLATIARMGVGKARKALTAKNACKACAYGMGGQRGGMTNELDEFPSVCNKSVQAQSTDLQPAIPHEIFEHTLADLQELTGREMEHLGRLGTPLFKAAGSDRYKPVDWDFALDHAARKLAQTDPRRSFFYSSGRSSNEAGFLFQLLARAYGTNNVNKEVLVVGGGNTAVEEALFLTNFASKVILVHRRNEFRAERILQERLFKNPRIEVRWNTEIADIGGSAMPPSVNSVTLRDLAANRTYEQPIDGIFIAIGHAPSTSIFAGKLDMKPGGYLKVRPGTTETNIPGVFAAGDVTDDVYRQAITAAGMGCMAALEAERFLAEHELAEAAE